MNTRGFGYCGLACDYCSDVADCIGCKQGGCPDKENCKNYQCCLSKGYSYCYECKKFPCQDSILHKLRVRTFCKFIKLYGERELHDCLKRNSKKGIIYHYKGMHIGDYDQFSSEEELVKFIKQK